jgi:hypothetical protein
MNLLWLFLVLAPSGLVFMWVEPFVVMPLALPLALFKNEKNTSVYMSARWLLLLLVASHIVWSQDKPVDSSKAEPTIAGIKQSVVFLETHWSEPNAAPAPAPLCAPNTGHKCAVGTGFLIFKEMPELGNDSHGAGLGIDYLVTAKHMIRERRDDGSPGKYAEFATVRFNTVNSVDATTGRFWDTFNARILDSRGDLMWFTDETDSIADVALTPVWLGNNAEYLTLPTSMFLTSKLIESQKINENDEVLFAGLFTNYFGALKNYPIVRHGKLSLLTNEPIPDPAYAGKKSSLYFAEITSFGGNSGSPVFLRIGPLREGLDINLRLSYNYYLLGVMKGFWTDQEAKQNSGIAAVVPADKIAEILVSDKIKAYEARAVGQALAAKGNLKSAEPKFQESISILRKVAPEGSQLVSTLRAYAEELKKAGRKNEADKIADEADKIASRPMSKPPEP